MSDRDELAAVLSDAYEVFYEPMDWHETTRVADAILAAGYQKPRTIKTVEELEAILADDERHVILTDIGGFVWWSEYTSEGNLLHGCAGPRRPGETGLAIEFWGNAYRAPEAIQYGPFTVLYDNATALREDGAE